jgi:hypothetical protein
MELLLNYPEPMVQAVQLPDQIERGQKHRPPLIDPLLEAIPRLSFYQPEKLLPRP